MPNVAIKSNFMFSQDWSPTGQIVVTPHDVTIRAGQDVTVDQGIIITVREGPIGATIKKGN